MFAMAALNDVYIIFCFGGDNGSGRFSTSNGDFGLSVANPTTGSIFQVGSQTYDYYIEFINEVMANYSSQPSLAMWDIMNEPNGNAAYAAYWEEQSNPVAQWTAWNQAITTAVVADNHNKNIITMGTAMGLFQQFTQTDFNQMENNSCGVCQDHVYITSTTSSIDANLHNEANWAAALGKPFIMGEAGFAETGPPWGIFYSPWEASEATKYNMSVIWMTAWNMSGYPVSAYNISQIPAVPGGYGFIMPPTGTRPTTNSTGNQVQTANITFVGEILSGSKGNILGLVVIGAGMYFAAMAGTRKRKR